MSYFSPQRHSHLEEFETKLANEWIHKATCGRDYVNIFKLQRWMRGPSTSNKDLSNLQFLLIVAWANWDWQYATEAPSSKSISARDRCALLVFSILLELGYGHVIKIFQKGGILDNVLHAEYLDYDVIVAELHNFHIRDAEQLVTRFEKKRWSYCPVSIKHGMARTFHAGNWVIPFCRRQAVNDKSGTAKVSHVLVQEDFVAEEVRRLISGSKIEDPEYGPVSVMISCHVED